MQEGSYIWIWQQQQHRAVNNQIDRIFLTLLVLAAILLFSIDIGEVPLTSHEISVSLVASKISKTGIISYFASDSVLTPHLIHWLVALAYFLGGNNEWTTRLPAAILTSFSVPLLYCIARETFRIRAIAIYSSFIYLTILPVVCYGRLAISDGIFTTILMVLILSVLRSRRDLRCCLGIGICLGMICLTKGLLAILLTSIMVMVFLFWDTPRILISYYLWLGIFIGLLPSLTWYIYQLVEHNHWSVNWGNQTQPPWYYCVELIKWTWPWLVFLPQTIRATWENRNFSWAKLVIVWGGAYLLMISLVKFKLAWYMFPVYPSLALAWGFYLTQIEEWISFFSYPRIWAIGFAILSLVASAASIYLGLTITGTTDLQMVLVSGAVTMILAAILAQKQDRQFLPILVWGSYISLLLLVRSHYWIW